MHLPGLAPPVRSLALLLVAACPDGGGTTTTSNTEGATGDASTGTGETTNADCASDGAPASFFYNLRGPLPGPPGSVAWNCTVDGVAGGCDEWTLTLACSDDGVAFDEAVTLDLTLTPAVSALPFAAGMAVAVRYMEALPFWVESAIRIEAADGSLLLAAARGSGDLDPFSPQHVGPGALIRTAVDECGTSRYYEVAFDLGGPAKGSLIPPSHGESGAYAVWAIAEDTLAISDQCYDLPWAWEEVLVLRSEP